jgi:hypothetical protein
MADSRPNPLYDHELAQRRTRPWSPATWALYLGLTIGAVALAAVLWSYLAAVILAALSLPQFILRYRRDRQARS